MKKLLCLGLGMTMLSGCLLTREDVKEAEQKKVMQEQVVYLQKNTADASSRFNEVESSLREMNGRLEILETQTQNSKDQSQQQKKHSEEQTIELAKKVTLLQEEINKMIESQRQMGQDLDVLKSALANNVKSANEENKSDTKKTSFDHAEKLFAEKEFKKAALQYQKFREQQPKSKKIPEATYKLGVCFQELGMKEDAKAFYEEVISTYPQSEFAKKSKQRSRQLK